MTSPNSTNLFQSQKIEQHGSPPLLLGNVSGNRRTSQNIDKYHDKNQSMASASLPYIPQEEQTPPTWDMKIEASLIPSLPVYYILEHTSLALHDIPVRTVESRLADFLRIHSISYSYHADTACLDCVTSSLLKFVIQFWHVGGADAPNRVVTLELQRRQGSVIEMQIIRRKMFQAVETGEQMQTPLMTRSHMHALTVPDTIMADVDVMSNYDHNEGCKDGVQICLRLLKSNSMDQIQLGLESLRMLTDASIVSRQDALNVSKAVLFREGPFGDSLQMELSRHSFGRAAALCVRAPKMEYGYSQALSHNEAFHNLGLAILSNALDRVEIGRNGSENMDTISTHLTNTFWQLVTEDLLYNVQKAVQTPNEAAVSAKCIRCLKSLSTNGSEMIGPAMVGSRGFRACLAQAHRFGARHHWMLEQESQKLLDTFC
jgi:hypothetical protein